MPDPVHSEERIRRGRWRSIAIGTVSVLFAWQSLTSRRSGREAVVASPEEAQSKRPHTAFEPTDWNLGPVALVYAGVLVLLVVSAFVVMAGYPTALPDVGRTRRITPPGPGLQTNPERDLRRLRADEERKLDTYYWIDRQKGVVHIPIEQAMKKLAATGIPGFPKAQQ
ncbi:MAG TPA: hypothetical protein VFT69_02895 [Pseudolabrys sp.]|nr:hypothetical protein [Pseudolabrys sp.]